MAVMNFVVKYDETYADEIKACTDRMDELHRDYVENHDNQNPVERLRKKIAYKVAYYKWLNFGRKAGKLTRHWIEYDGRVFDIDWQKIGGAEATRRISEIIEKEELAEKKTDNVMDIALIV